MQGARLPYAGPSETASLEQDYYRIWVPDNAIKVELEFDAGSSCTLYAYYRSLGLPCPYYAPYYDAPCYDESQYMYSGSTRSHYKYYSSNFRFVTEGYWFIGIGRDSTYYADQYCPYNVTVSFVTCPENETDWEGYGDVTYCVPKLQEDQVSLPAEWDVHDKSTFSFDIMIPEDIGVFTVFVNTTNYYLDIYGYSWGPATYYGPEDGEYDYTTEMLGGETYYYHRYDTYAPRPGRYNIMILDSNEDNFNGTVKAWFTACSVGMVGPNCTGVLHDEGDLNTPVTKTSEGYDYWRFHLHRNSTLQVNVSVTDVTAGGYGYVVWKIAGYPSYSSYGGYDSYYYYQSFSGVDLITINLYRQDAELDLDWIVGVQTYTPTVTFEVSAVERVVDDEISTGDGTTSSGIETTSQSTTAQQQTTATTATTAATATSAQQQTTSTGGMNTTTTEQAGTTTTSGTTSSTATTGSDDTTTAGASVLAISGFVVLCAAVLML